MVLEDSMSYEEVIGMLHGKDPVKAKEDAELSSRIYEESKNTSTRQFILGLKST